MSGLGTQAVTRRTVLRGLGTGALGLAGAALLGCGTQKSDTAAPAASSKGQEQGGKGSGAWLPLVAPVVQGKPKNGGTFSYAATASFLQHDPGTALAGNVWHVIGEKGLEPDPQTASIRPHVLTSWEVADPSGTTLIFKVAPNLFIHDKAPWNGRQFTAEDVAWNMERIGGLYAEKLKIPLSAFQRASMVGNIQKAVAVDPTTVKVTLSKPNSSFFNGLMDTRVPFAPREMDDIGWTDPMKMGGIGPYQITSSIKDQAMTFKKFDKYFRPGEPHFDNYNIPIVPDRTATIAAFLSGQNNLITNLVPTEIDSIRKVKPDSQLYSWIDSNWNHFRPGMAYEPFRDFRVRKAISLAMDRNALSDAYYGPGWGYQSSMCPGYPEAWRPEKVKALPGYNPDTKAADRAEAAKLLTAAGYPNGKGLDWDIIFTASTGSSVANDDSTRFIAQMQSQFPDIKIVIKPLPDSATFATQQAAGKFKMVAYTITAAPDAVVEMTSQYYTGGSRNYGQFTDKSLDTLLDKAQVELNKDARTKLMDDFQGKFETDWMPMYVLRANPARHFIPGNVGGYDTVAGTWYGYSYYTKASRWFYVEA